MRTLYITKGGQEMASSRHRVYNVLESLSKKGFDCNTLRYSITNRRIVKYPINALQLTRILKTTPTSKITTIQKVLPNKKCFSIIRSLADKLIYDLDDAIYINPQWRNQDRKYRRNRLRWMLPRVDCVTVGSPGLADVAKKYAENVHIVHPALKQDNFVNIDCVKTDKLVVGWIGMGHSLWYLDKIESALTNVLNTYEDTELWILTNTDVANRPLESRIGRDVRYLQWSKSREKKCLSAFDISIRPQTYDEFTRLKGGFVSVLSAMASRTPVIVTPVGMLDDIVDHGVSGFHAEDKSDWVTYLKTLVENEDRRSSMGSEAYSCLSTKGFWSHQVSSKLVSIYEDII